MRDYSRRLAQRIAEGAQGGDFVLALGGDCSILLGTLLAFHTGRRIGLAYLDSHADFATPEQSRTGSVASMCLGLAVGRGSSPLAHLAPAGPLVQGEDVVLIGRRDDAAAPHYGQGALREYRVLDLPDADVRALGAAGTAEVALRRLTKPQVNGFWIHLDADVLDPALLPAVDSPEPGGLSFKEVVDLLRPLVRHPAALGLEVTIYDPALDPAGAAAETLAQILVHVLNETQG